MRVRPCGDATEFLARTAEYRAKNPELTNVIGSVATGVAQGVTYERCFWWVIEDADVVVGCAMRTAPWRLAVPELAPDPARALGAAVATADPDVPGINGPRGAVEAVYRGLGIDLADVTFGHENHLLVLGQHRPPNGVQGVARVADESDADRVLDWWVRFEEEAELSRPDTDEAWRDRVLLRVRQGGLMFWEADGAPVALAGYAPLVDGPTGAVARIGPVYTPPQHRRRGFGSAVTSAMVDHLLPRASIVMLYADAANPTSNRIYEALGFRRLTTFVETERVRTA
jgi:RimJ/RimL family protein N-acetyltransferase